MGAVVATPGKAIQFPHQYNIKQVLVTVPNHPKKVFPLLCVFGSRFCPVNIGVYDSDTLPLSVFGTFPDLALNGFFTLTVRREPGIDNSFHFASSSVHIWNNNSFNRLLSGDFESKHISINCRLSFSTASGGLRHSYILPSGLSVRQQR